VFDSDSEDDPPLDEIQIFTPPAENADADSQSVDDRPISVGESAGFYSGLECASAGASAEAWNIFASSSDDEELEGAYVNGRRRLGSADNRLVLWQ
jgi:hypothetical protein